MRDLDTLKTGPQAPVFFVCSPRPRTGKTLLARLLIDFFRLDDYAVTAFDANPDDPVLSEYLPYHTEPATIADTRGQMALFDRLIVGEGALKVVDVASDQFERLVDVLGQTDFAGEAEARSIRTVILFIVEDHPNSVEGYERVLTEAPRAILMPVHNEVNEGFNARSVFPINGAVAIHVPHLPPYMRGVVNRRDFSFAEHLKRTKTRQNRLHHWIDRPFSGFRDLELRLSLAEGAPRILREA